MSGLGGPHWPGVPAWPSTHPVAADTNVTEETAKLGGTGGAAGGVGAAAVWSRRGVPVACGRPGPVEECCAGVVEPSATVGVPPIGPFKISRGTAIAPATTTAAAAAAIAARPSFRRRARFLTRSKASGRGSKGVTRSSSQASMSSRGSSMGFPQNRAELGPRVV